MITTKQILKAIDCKHLQLYKGNGYYYFCYDTFTNCAQHGKFETYNINVCRLNDFQFDNWVKAGKEFVKRCEAV